MSKGLELFQELRKSLNEMLIVSNVANEKLDIIEQELNDYEEMKHNHILGIETCNRVLFDKELAKKLAVIDILKKNKYSQLDIQYNNMYNINSWQITAHIGQTYLIIFEGKGKQEYDLLKEVLL